MRAAIFDRVDPPVPTELPLRLTATCSRRSAAVLLVLAIPLVLGAGLGSLMLVLDAAITPGVRAVVAEHPALGLEVATALAFWTYLLALPLKRPFDRLAARRTIFIDAETVAVCETGHFRCRTWTAPRSAFSGLTHHVRASLSGTRHELILVHPDREKSVLLAVADRMTQGEVDRVAALLEQKEIPPGELYRMRDLWPRIFMPAGRNPAHA